VSVADKGLQQRRCVFGGDEFGERLPKGRRHLRVSEQCDEVEMVKQQGVKQNNRFVELRTRSASLRNLCTRANDS
jgi:hypothetical protein